MHNNEDDNERPNGTLSSISKFIKRRLSLTSPNRLNIDLSSSNDNGNSSTTATTKKRSSTSIESDQLALLQLHIQQTLSSTSAAHEAAAAQQQQQQLGRRQSQRKRGACTADIDPLALRRLIVEGAHEQFAEVLARERVAAMNTDLDSRFKYDEGATLAHLAAKFGRTEMLAHLYDLGVFLDSHDQHMATPLLYAVASGSQKACVFLLSKGAQVDCKDCTGNTPFHIALKLGNQEIMNLLLLFHVDINAKGVRGNTVLHVACAEADCTKVKFLLEKGAQPTRTNAKGQTAIHSALHNLQVLKIIIEHMMEKKIPVIKYLNMKDEQGSTLLHNCVELGYADSFSYLLNTIVSEKKSNAVLGSLFNDKDIPCGNTLLHLSVKVQRLDMVSALLSYPDVDANAQNKQGNTALHLALELKNQPIVNILVQSHATLSIKNNAKMTALDLAKKQNMKLKEEKRKSIFNFRFKI